MHKPKKNYLWNKLSDSLKKLNFDYKNLINSKILISGGTGFVGSWIVHSFALLNKLFLLNIELTIITNQKKNVNKYFFLKKFIKINYILSDINKIKKVDGNFTHLIHGCANYTGERNDILKTNIGGAEKILSILKKKKIKNILFISSGAVYENKNLKLKETNALVDINSKKYYAVSKVKSEKIFSEYYNKNKNINLTILRLFTFAGPGLDTLKYLAYSSAINSRFKNNKIKLNSDGQSKRGFMHSIDMALWIIKSLTFKKKNIINVGSNEILTIYEMSKIVSSVKYKNFKKVDLTISKNIKHNSFYVPNTNRAVKKDLKINFTIQDAIRDHLFHKMNSKNPHRYYFND